MVWSSYLMLNTVGQKTKVGMIPIYRDSSMLRNMVRVMPPIVPVLFPACPISPTRQVEGHPVHDVLDDTRGFASRAVPCVRPLHMKLRTFHPENTPSHASALASGNHPPARTDHLPARQIIARVQNLSIARCLPTTTAQ
eukprot:2398610-Amphidinium_carterae.1